MFEWPGYQIVEWIDADEELLLCRLVHAETGQRLIAKTTQAEYPGAEAIRAFRHEYEIFVRLNGAGAALPYALEVVQERPVLLLRDFGGGSPKQLQHANPALPRLPAQLAAAASIADCVAQLHRERMTLAVVSLAQFLIHPETNEARLIDLRRCSAPDADSPLATDAGLPASLLPYLSPERTGRLGIASDYRSDLYSLGIVLYEWLTGSLPFESPDAIELVHRHLAVTPAPARHRNPALPAAVSDIVGKCMEKMPDARYASAFGIKSDLEDCLARLRDFRRKEPFVLGLRDVPDRWSFPARLYGRDAERERLLAALGRAADGEAETVWVSGIGGIGKSSFVHETLRAAVPSGAFFATGKLTPNPAAVPYELWVQVLAQLVDRLLTKNELQSEMWKLRILSAIDGYGQLLIERVPKLELLIGRQPALPPLTPIETQHRFHLVLDRFIRLFADPSHPLLLFLDDLQWADEASLHYLERLIADPLFKHRLLVGSYRDEEPAPPTAVESLVRQAQEMGLSGQHLRLKPLDADGLAGLLGDAMRADPAELAALAAVLLHKTEGNPFYLKQFIAELLDRKLVYFQAEDRLWQWNLALIQELDVPDNAADYIAQRIRHLPSGTAWALSLAACLGHRFGTEAVAAIGDLSEDELRESFAAAVQDRLLQRADRGRSIFAFQHDRIRQAAYSLIAKEKLPAIHLRIGRMLIDRLPPEDDAALFEAVNHLNEALPLVRDDETSASFADWNLRAGLSAKNAAAYVTSLGYFRRATELLPPDSWRQRYPIAFRAHLERAEAEYLCAHYEEANRLFDELLRRSAADLDKALVMALMMQYESNKGNYKEVVRLGKLALALTGQRANTEPGKLGMARLWTSVRRKLRRRPVASIAGLPRMTDPARLAAMSLLAKMTHAYFILDKNAWFAVNMIMLDLTLEAGLAPEAATAFVGYAMVLNFRLFDYKQAYEWGMLACELSRPYPAQHNVVNTMFLLCHDSWRQYNPDLLYTMADESGKVGLESGDLWSANQSVLLSAAFLLMFAHPLGDIYDRLLAQAPEVKRHDNELVWMEFSILAGLMRVLTGETAEDDPFVDLEAEQSSLRAPYQGSLVTIVPEAQCLTQYMSCYFMGRYRESLHYLQQSAALIESRRDEFEHSSQYMYETLVRGALFEEFGEKERKESLARIRSFLKPLRTYAKRCPVNYRHKYLLVKAEWARLTNNRREAERCFESAIEDARKHGHIHNVGIACETFAKFGLSQGREQMAKLYLNEAYDAYMQWGATAKAKDLAAKYGHLLGAGTRSRSERADYLSVVMSARTLSGEMEMSRLLETVMGIMLRNSGAEYGALIIDQAGRWSVEASGTAESLSIGSVPLEQASALVPTAIIGYAARTREEIVLHDAAREGMFALNGDVGQRRLKSVLCLPIKHQNNLIGLLYLENTLSRGLFTPERLDVLKLLSAQCAVSIDNARLYSSIQQLKTGLEQQVAERTRSLEQSMNETAAALAEMSVYEERNRIAQEIHDVVGHTLTSTILQVEAGKRLLHKDKEGAAERLAEAQNLVRHGLNEIRRSVHMLKDGHTFDLEQTLRRLIQDTERNTGVAVETNIDPLPNLSTAHKKTIYHALQEGLTNGIRHGASTEFRFFLLDDGQALQFALEDNGVGAEAIMLGFGLRAMKERTEQLGGQLQVTAKPGRGCSIRIRLPLTAQRQEEREHEDHTHPRR